MNPGAAYRSVRDAAEQPGQRGEGRAFDDYHTATSASSLATDAYRHVHRRIGGVAGVGARLCGTQTFRNQATQVGRTATRGNVDAGSRRTHTNNAREMWSHERVGGGGGERVFGPHRRRCWLAELLARARIDPGSGSQSAPSSGREATPWPRAIDVSRVEDVGDEADAGGDWGEGRVIAVSTQLRLQCSEERPKKLSLTPFLLHRLPHSPSAAGLLSLCLRRLCPPTRTVENFTISPSGKIIYSGAPPTPSRLEWNRATSLAPSFLQPEESPAACSLLALHPSTISFFFLIESEHGCRCDRTVSPEIRERRSLRSGGKIKLAGGRTKVGPPTFLVTSVQF